MRKLDLESLLFFKSVADLGSITQAARQLNRVQSNVTTRVKNLEERLGVKLFLRHGNRLTLSADGERLRATPKGFSASRQKRNPPCWFVPRKGH